MTLLHLVRHGESTWNSPHRAQRQSASPPLLALTGEATSAAVCLADVGAVGPRISNGLWVPHTTNVIGE